MLSRNRAHIKLPKSKYIEMEIVNFMIQYYINNTQYSREHVQNLNWQDYLLKAYQKKPLKLYKYFPNIEKDGRNYSIEALKNNTVFLQSPILFDDPYDSTISIDENTLVLKRLYYYAKLCNFSVNSNKDYGTALYEFALYLYNKVQEGNSLETIFRLNTDNKRTNRINSLFVLRLENSLLKNPNVNDSWQQAFFSALREEYNDMQEILLKKFRVSCFTTTPYSMLMWSHYANYHKGFCIEYEFSDDIKKYEKILSNILPVIYSNERKNVLNACLQYLENETISEEVVWDIYKYGLLTKSLDWRYQNEWRLISLDSSITDSKYNCDFFPITKVYLGNRMEPNERTKLIKICQAQNIPYRGIVTKKDRYQMCDCPISCEKCDWLNKAVLVY